MRRLLPSLLLAAAVTAAAAPAAQHRAADRRAAEAQRHAADADRLAKKLAGLQPGRPQSCLSNAETRNAQTTAIGSTILYEVNRGLIYRTDTNGGCEAIARGDILVTRSNGGQVCQGDIGETFQPTIHIPTGSCALGEFVPYRRR